MTHRERAERIVSGLPLADRIRLVSGRDRWRTEQIPGAVPSVTLADGPHGVRREVANGHPGMPDSVPSTCFPPATTLACTWDTDLLEEVGRALGREARSQDVAVLLGPGLNLIRHPRGGRSFEYFSEDPLLSGRMAAALVRGIQAEGVTACLKHYAANNQETARMVVDAVIDERTLRELYLRGFEVALAESAPGAVMTAYNRVNGQHCSDHRELVARILRGEWGFDGLVVSDWGGTNDRVAGLAVGMDLEMPGGTGAFDEEVAQAIASGRLAEADLDRSAARVVEVALRAQEPHEPALAASEVQAHHDLARRAAAAGTVLLTNAGLLPLPPEGSLAVIGAFAEHPRYQGGGSSRVHPTGVDCLLDALGKGSWDLDLQYAPGYDPTTGRTTPALLAEAAGAAHAADRVVLMLGLPDPFEVEGRDRDHCRLPDSMDQLAEVVLAANPSTAVVLVNGGALEVPWADRPAALVEAHLGGQAGGSALADVLLGRTEPGGRLAQSMPVAAGDLPASRNFPGHRRLVEYRECLAVGYRWHDAGTPARFPFGHGLGYTTFALGHPVVTGAGTDLTVSVDVTNTGTRAGSHVVQVYVRDVQASVARPAKELAAFTKVHLEPGTTGRAAVQLDRRSFAVWDVAAHAWLVEAGEFEILVGASSTDIRGRATVTIDSPDRVTPVPAPAGPVATGDEFAALLGGPLPQVGPSRPFTRNSTLADLDTSRLGRLLAAGMRAAVARRFPAGTPDPPPDVREPTLSRLPLRSFVLMGGGPMTFHRLDRILAVLNGQVRDSIGRRR